MTDDIRLISIVNIIDPAKPMRSGLELEGIAALGESIKREGLINPITVRPVGEKFEVVAGHRRFTACRLVGITDIQCVVRDLTDEQAIEIMAHENLERQDVDPVDEALMIGRYVGEDESKVQIIATKMHRSIEWVRDRLAILEYPDYLVAAIKSGRIALGVAKYLGAVGDEAYRKMFVEQAIRDGMKVLHAQYLFAQWDGGLFKAGSEILPSPDTFPPAQQSRARAICARCQKLAIEPNLQNDFIHFECPDDKEPEQLAAPSSAVGGGAPSERTA